MKTELRNSERLRVLSRSCRAARYFPHRITRFQHSHSRSSEHAAKDLGSGTPRMQTCMRGAKPGTVRVFPRLPYCSVSFSVVRTLASFILFLFQREERTLPPYRSPSCPSPLPALPASIFIVITNLIKFRASTSYSRGCVKHFN